MRHSGRLPGISITICTRRSSTHYCHSVFLIFDDLQAKKMSWCQGSRNRLMNYTVKRGEQQDKATSELKHYRPMEFVVPLNEHDATIGH